MRQNKRIAITGGIGSGKSTVLAVFRELGYPVFSCDEIYAELLTEPDFIKEIQAVFPQCVKGEKLDRAELSKLVFSDTDGEIERLNALTHPRILERLLKNMDGYPLAFAEVPLLYEGGFEQLFDGVIAVYREQEERIRAVQERSGLTREEVEKRIARQYPQEKLKERTEFVIENTGSEERLKEQAIQLIGKFIE